MLTRWPSQRALYATLAPLFVATLVALPSWVGAHAGHDHSKDAPEAAALTAERKWTAGTVRKVDLVQKKITLQHGEIVTLNMPAMTMVFQLQRVELASGLEVGSKVLFVAEKQGSRFVVTELQPAP